jgi:hypothetical protein
VYEPAAQRAKNEPEKSPFGLVFASSMTFEYGGMGEEPTCTWASVASQNN